MPADYLDAIRHNAYRVLGINVSATSAEVRKAAERARLYARIGTPPRFKDPVPHLGPCDRSEKGIQQALANLLVPSTRLRERLFWFDEAQSTTNRMGESPARTLLKPTLGEAGIRWQPLFGDNQFWDDLLAADRMVPRATERDLERLRAELPDILLRPLAETIAGNLRRGSDTSAKALFEFFSVMRNPPSVVQFWAYQAIEPLQTPFEKAVRAVRSGSIEAIRDASQPWRRLVAIGADNYFRAKRTEFLSAAMNLLAHTTLSPTAKLPLAEALLPIAQGTEFARDVQDRIARLVKAVPTSPSPSVTTSTQASNSARPAPKAQGASTAPALPPARSGWGYICRLVGHMRDGSQCWTCGAACTAHRPRNAGHIVWAVLGTFFLFMGFVGGNKANVYTITFFIHLFTNPFSVEGILYGYDMRPGLHLPQKIEWVVVKLLSAMLGLILNTVTAIIVLWICLATLDDESLLDFLFADARTSITSKIEPPGKSVRKPVVSV